MPDEDEGEDLSPNDQLARLRKSIDALKVKMSAIGGTGASEAGSPNAGGTIVGGGGGVQIGSTLFM